MRFARLVRASRSCVSLVRLARAFHRRPAWCGVVWCLFLPASRVAFFSSFSLAHLLAGRVRTRLSAGLRSHSAQRGGGLTSTKRVQGRAISIEAFTRKLFDHLVAPVEPSVAVQPLPPPPFLSPESHPHPLSFGSSVCVVCCVIVVGRVRLGF